MSTANHWCNSAQSVGVAWKSVKECFICLGEGQDRPKIGFPRATSMAPVEKLMYPRLLMRFLAKALLLPPPTLL